MILLNLSLKGIYGFDDFNINFSYPKKIVNSIIEEEHLDGRERFRYKKVVVLMGANATGKTSMGKALFHIYKSIKDGNTDPLFEMVTNKQGYFSIDFVNGDYRLQRLSANIDVENKTVEIKYQTSNIGLYDSYEKCVEKLEDKTGDITITSLKRLVGDISVSPKTFPTSH